MLADPYTYLRLHEEELGRTLAQKALERAAREAEGSGPTHAGPRVRFRLAVPSLGIGNALRALARASLGGRSLG
jgi:hypothetical protein